MGQKLFLKDRSGMMFPDKIMINEECEPLAGVIFTDIVTDLERCGDNAINVAYALKGPKPQAADM